MSKQGASDLDVQLRFGFFALLSGQIFRRGDGLYLDLLHLWSLGAFLLRARPGSFVGHLQVTLSYVEIPSSMHRNSCVICDRNSA